MIVIESESESENEIEIEIESEIEIEIETQIYCIQLPIMNRKFFFLAYSFLSIFNFIVVKFEVSHHL